MIIDLELTEKSAKNTQRWWKLTATIEALIENNTFVKFKQDMLQYTSLYMINNTLYDIYFDMRINV